MSKPELLCPVGSKESLRAAILGGADAVYFGTRNFNARMNAKNFSPEETKDAIALCHENGVRAYVTMNTLLTDRLLPAALETAEFLYRHGADALIVADVGFARILRENFPDFPLHASTQMSCHNSHGARFLDKMGFSRVVVARELDKENLRTLCDASPIDVEMFVHGAICASHSGQCLMSSMIGERSGNRGECAQPCRLPYNGAYPISFKDLSLACHLREICSFGVKSLKIEGRMKGASYVYSVARVFRTLLDEERDATEGEMQKLMHAFSRSGFTDGYYIGKKDGNMLGIRTREDKEKSRESRPSFVPSSRKAEPISVHREERKAVMPPLPPKTKVPFSRSARFLSADQIPDTDFFSVRYLPLARFDPKKANGVILPCVVFDSEWDEVRRQLEQAVSQGAEHILIGNVGHFPLAEHLPATLHGDFRLNATNSFAPLCHPLRSSFLPSPELGLSQLRDLRGEREVIVYGRIPVMLLEKKVGAKALRDRKGILFPVVGEGKRDVVYNSVPFYMLDKQKDLKEKGLVSAHFIFTVETKAQIEKICSDWREKKEPKQAVRRIK